MEPFGGSAGVQLTRGSFGLLVLNIKGDMSATPPEGIHMWGCSCTKESHNKPVESPAYLKCWRLTTVLSASNSFQTLLTQVPEILSIVL
jgi:hypothetical protein